MPTLYQVDHPYPGPVPLQDGGVLDLWPDGGLLLRIQLHDLSPAELAAFRAGFERYWYLGLTEPLPLAYWSFGWPRPINAVECNFDARLANPQALAAHLDTTDGVKNALTVHLLDGQMLRAQKLVGLRPEALAAWHATLRAQLATPYTRQDYLRVLCALEQAYTAQELQRLGTEYRK